MKSLEPRVLAENAVDWTNEYVAATPDQRRRLRRWSDSAIKSALLAEVNKKCAYCESRILAVDFGDVEHILPKSIYPHLVVQWSNLTIACSRCNGAKQDKDDPALPMINPYVDDPDEYFVFFGSMIHARPGQDRAIWTIDQIDLNRLDLVAARDRALAGLKRLLDNYERSPVQLRDAIRDAIATYIHDEYTAMLGKYRALVESSS